MRIALLIALFCILFIPGKVFAVTVQINNPPTSISSSEFNLNITVQGASEGKNYLRVDLYKDGSTNYFGETFNGSEWYKDSDGKKYPSIDIVAGTDWTGDIKARVGSPNPNDYDGQGAYKIRIRRYTNSGSLGTEDPNLSSVPISITVPTQTPTPTLTPTPTQSPSSTPTSTPTPSESPTKIPTPTISKAPTPTINIKITPSPTSAVLAAKTSQQQPGQPKETSDQGVELGSKLGDLEPSDKGYNWWKLLIVMGAVIITGATGVFLYNNHIKERSEELSQGL